MPTGKHIAVRGYDALLEAVAGKTPPVFVLFSGSKDAAGKSWCPDCVSAEPVVKEAAKKLLPDSATFIHCDVGERALAEFSWKDGSNPFRTDPKLKLTGVPTLLKWNTNEKLVEEQCMKSDLVEMLFEE